MSHVQSVPDYRHYTILRTLEWKAVLVMTAALHVYLGQIAFRQGYPGARMGPMRTAAQSVWYVVLAESLNLDQQGEAKCTYFKVQCWVTPEEVGQEWGTPSTHSERYTISCYPLAHNHALILHYLRHNILLWWIIGCTYKALFWVLSLFLTPMADYCIICDNILSLSHVLGHPGFFPLILGDRDEI